RVIDIAKVCELRDYDVEGHREIILFLYRYFSACFTEDTEEALNRALELNAMFKNPLPENEVIQDTKSATRAYENRLYKYTNTKLIEILDITLDEQQHLITIISGKEKSRRSAKEQKAKKKERIDIKVKVEELKLESLSLRMIADRLDISLGKVQRVLKK